MNLSRKTILDFFVWKGQLFWIISFWFILVYYGCATDQTYILIELGMNGMNIDCFILFLCQCYHRSW